MLQVKAPNFDDPNPVFYCSEKLFGVEAFQTEKSEEKLLSKVLIIKEWFQQFSIEMYRNRNIHTTYLNQLLETMATKQWLQIS